MSKVVIAFSGGLDTSMLVPYMREKYNASEIITCAVDTGGFSKEECERIEKRADELKVDEHFLIDASQAFYDEIIKYLVYGNVTRDGYPLCVGAERLIQAREALKVAKDKGATILAHGSTGAGNDQYRFDLVINVLGQAGLNGKNEAIQSVAPIREFGIKREFSQNFLKERGYGVSDKAAYSYNVGLWGVSIGGKETLVSDGLIPEDAWYTPLNPSVTERMLEITFEKGEAVKMSDGSKTYEGPLSVIKQLAIIAGEMGVGRHYHVGTSIPGKKGRLAYESPAADVLYEAHRTLEKLTLTQSQIFFKKHVADEFGKLIHEARFFDPLLDDLRACLESSQKRVSGVCKVRLLPGRIDAVAATSPYDLLGAGGSLYGEFADAYTPADAAGSSKLHAYEQVLYHSMNRK